MKRQYRCRAALSGDCVIASCPHFGPHDWNRSACQRMCKANQQGWICDQIYPAELVATVYKCAKAAHEKAQKICPSMNGESPFRFTHRRCCPGVTQSEFYWARKELIRHGALKYPQFIDTGSWFVLGKMETTYE